MTLGTRNRSLATFLITLLTAACLPAAAASDSPAGADFTGRWEGTLEVGENSLRLVFHVDRAEDGTLQATIDSPDQGGTGIPVAEVTAEGSSIHFDVRVLSAEYDGRLGDEGRTIEGEWRQSGLTLPLEIARDEGGTG